MAFVAGQKVRASYFNPLVQIASSTSASAAIGTTATAILTITGCVFKAGRAYSVENVGGVHADADGRYADFSVFKTSTAGTQYGAFYRTRAATNPTNCYGKIYLRRSAGTDLTVDLVLAVTASAGTVTCDGSAALPRALVVTDVGLATAYSYAFDVT